MCSSQCNNRALLLRVESIFFMPYSYCEELIKSAHQVICPAIADLFCNCVDASHSTTIDKSEM